MQVPWILAVVAVIGLLLNLGGMALGLMMLKSSLKLYETGQEAIWSEIMVIKQALGLANGSPGKFVTREKLETLEQWAQDTRMRLDSHSERLKSLEIGAARHGE